MIRFPDAVEKVGIGRRKKVAREGPASWRGGKIGRNSHVAAATRKSLKILIKKSERGAENKGKQKHEEGMKDFCRGCKRIKAEACDKRSYQTVDRGDRGKRGRYVRTQPTHNHPMTQAATDATGKTIHGCSNEEGDHVKEEKQKREGKAHATLPESSVASRELLPRDHGV